MLFAVGCGTRTGLLVLGDEPAPGQDGEVDASIDRRADTQPEPDALPPIDVNVPDVPFHSNCPDAGGTYVYVVTSENDLYSFFPPDLSFTRIGTLACPSSPGETPFSMTVDREGVAYVVFTDGNLFRVSTKTAACAPTKYVPNQQGFKTFGMGYAANTTDPGETLFVAPSNLTAATEFGDGLATIDTTTLTLHFIGQFAPVIAPPELTGTADGRLFAWAPNRGTGGAPATGSHLYQIDKATAKIVGAASLNVGSSQDAFAFAHWGGQFWIFTSPGGASTVTRYDPATGTETDVTSLPQTIVGAGVSTCAPSR